jgi:hypothetical protein
MARHFVRNKQGSEVEIFLTILFEEGKVFLVGKPDYGDIETGVHLHCPLIF